MDSPVLYPLHANSLSQDDLSIASEACHAALSASQMRKDMKTASQSLDLFFKAKFVEAEILITSQENWKGSLYLTTGVGLLRYVKSFFTFDGEDVAAAIKDIERALRIARQLKKNLERPNLAMRIYSSLWKSNGPILSDEYTGNPLSEEDVNFMLSQAQLIEAEASLLVSMLRIIGEPDGMNYMILLREVWNVRRGYIFYRQHEVKQGGKVYSSTNKVLNDDENFKSGICLGNGLINIIFAMMPPSIFKVFAVIGYTGDGDLGVEQLNECSNSDTIRAPIARIVLLFYYTVMCSSLSSNKEGGRLSPEERYDAVNLLLEVAFLKYPLSPIFLFFEGRANFLKYDVRSAIQSYNTAIEHSDDGWPSFKLVIYWDLVLGHMRMLQFEKSLDYSITLARDSKWSIVFCMYLEIVFRSAVARLTKSESLLKPINEMLKIMPDFEKRIAGRAFPMERFAITRGQMVLDGICELKFPEYELMTVWDSYAYMDEGTLRKAESDVRKGLVEENMSTVSKVLLSISLASILRTKQLLDGKNGALPILTHVITNPPKIICKCHTHILPLAHVEMAATLISLNRIKEAKVHYNLASKWKEKYYLDRTIQVRCSKLSRAFKK